MQLWKRGRWKAAPVLPAMRKQDRKSYVTNHSSRPQKDAAA